MATEKSTVKKQTATNAAQAPRKLRNEVEGRVVSDKMAKTISVQVFSLIRHTKYGKFIRKSSVFKAHDEKNEAKTGDLVRIFETRPLSKTKRWALAQIIEKSKQVAGVDV